MPPHPPTTPLSGPDDQNAQPLAGKAVTRRRDLLEIARRGSYRRYLGQWCAGIAMRLLGM